MLFRACCAVLGHAGMLVDGVHMYCARATDEVVVGGVLWRATARCGVAHCVDVLRTSGPRGGVVYLRDALKKVKSGGIIGPGARPAHIVQWDRARLPHLQWDRARTTSAPGLGSPSHICTGTGPHLHRD